eukprot:2509424-Alexandrium_andersonii.AAC.1
MKGAALREAPSHRSPVSVSTTMVQCAPSAILIPPKTALGGVCHVCLLVLKAIVIPPKTALGGGPHKA